MRKRNLPATLTALFALLTGYACGGGTGVCVSDAVEYTFGLRVYCYSDYTSDECAEYNNMQVNGANWSYHGGQTCADRDLDEGSNPWP